MNYSLSSRQVKKQKTSVIFSQKRPSLLRFLCGQCQISALGRDEPVQPSDITPVRIKIHVFLGLPDQGFQGQKLHPVIKLGFVGFPERLDGWLSRHLPALDMLISNPYSFFKSQNLPEVYWEPLSTCTIGFAPGLEANAALMVSDTSRLSFGVPIFQATTDMS